MARKYSKRSQEFVEEAMHEFKEWKLKSWKTGEKVENPKQAIAIGLSEAREAGEKVPDPPADKKDGKAGESKGKHKSKKKPSS